VKHAKDQPRRQRRPLSFAFILCKKCTGNNRSLRGALYIVTRSDTLERTLSVLFVRAKVTCTNAVIARYFNEMIDCCAHAREASTYLHGFR
jgi:hypothetical protein